MGYIVTGKGRNRRVKKILFGCSQSTITLWDVGPHTRPNQFNRAVCLMSCLEQRGMTDHWIYDAARQIAQALLGFGDKERTPAT